MADLRSPLSRRRREVADRTATADDKAPGREWAERQLTDMTGDDASGESCLAVLIDAYRAHGTRGVMAIISAADDRERAAEAQRARRFGPSH